jgi:hypothetical protein
MAEFTLTDETIVPQLTGCGVQLNQHVFAKLTGAPPESFPDLEEKVKRLAPQFIRIFFNDHQGDGGFGRTPSRKESFLRTARLARDTGAAINITWQGGSLETPAHRAQSVSRFADALDELVTAEGLDKLNWVTIQNEPNTPPKRNGQGKLPEKVVTPQRLDDMYERLDERLTEKGLRQQIRFMVGDLIRNNQKQWFRHMDRSLAELMDAYSVHIYWDYFAAAKFEDRLAEVSDIVSNLPHTGTKPILVTEYGVRGYTSLKPGSGDRIPKPGILRNRTEQPPMLSQTNVAAFQQAWFVIRSMQLGYAGTIKWDCYYGKYDPSYTQSHHVIGPPGAKGWPRYRMYHLLRLFTLTTEPGWRVVALTQSPAETTKKLVAVREATGKALTILGLDSGGALKDTDTGKSVTYSIGGLDEDARLGLFLWNSHGGGGLTAGGQVPVHDGVATVEVPLHAVFALTTKAVEL